MGSQGCVVAAVYQVTSQVACPVPLPWAIYPPGYEIAVATTTLNQGPACGWASAQSSPQHCRATEPWHERQPGLLQASSVPQSHQCGLLLCVVLAAGVLSLSLSLPPSCKAALGLGSCPLQGVGLVVPPHPALAPTAIPQPTPPCSLPSVLWGVEGPDSLPFLSVPTV